VTTSGGPDRTVDTWATATSCNVVWSRPNASPSPKDLSRRPAEQGDAAGRVQPRPRSRGPFGFGNSKDKRFRPLVYR